MWRLSPGFGRAELPGFLCNSAALPVFARDRQTRTGRTRCQNRNGEQPMKILGKAAAAIIVCGALASYASAAGTVQTTRHREWRARHSINARQRMQQRRIGEGVENGSLTAREAARLERREARFNRQEARLRRAGLSPRERVRLQAEQDRLSRQIYREKHDGQRQ